MKNNSQKVCIIGAGSSGIAAAKVLKDHQIPFDCFEKGSGIGGNWRYNNDNGMSSAYKSLHINTSKELMAYSDFPMPKDYPDYPHHSLILKYFEDYTKHFKILEHIHFNTSIEKVEKLENGLFEVLDSHGVCHNYSAILVANGHHWSPRCPDFKGHFDGESIHAHFYKTPDALQDKKVLVVGIGNSGVDIACEAARNAKKVLISTRSGAHIIPKYLFGKPTDTYTKPEITRLPMPIQRALLSSLLFISRGKQEAYGIPKPKRALLREHPTISADLLNLAGHGKIKIKPNISHLEGHTAFFTDNTKEEIDLIIYATGYNVQFPFFDKDLLKVENNQINLYHKIVHPTISDLYFIGLIQPLGAIMPLAELQAIYVAKLLSGAVKLPSKDKMLVAIKKDKQKMAKRYVKSARHTLQVDFFPYKRSIVKEMKRMKA